MALYHVRIMEQAGLIDCEFSSTFAGADADVPGFTWDGQEFLAAVKKDTVWAKVRETVAVKGDASPPPNAYAHPRPAPFGRRCAVRSLHRSQRLVDVGNQIFGSLYAAGQTH